MLKNRLISSFVYICEKMSQLHERFTSTHLVHSPLQQESVHFSPLKLSWKLDCKIKLSIKFECSPFLRLKFVSCKWTADEL